MGRTSQELIAPFLTGDAARSRDRMSERRWEGRGPRKPWDRPVTATFAHLETPELVPVVVQLLRLQTADPHVIIVDTGSSEATCRELEKHRAPDVEIHYIRSHAYRHPSSPVSAACDLAMALTTTPYLFFTHVDVFLRRRDVLDRWLDQCDRLTPVVGYRMSDRSFMGTRDWKWMVSHTATLVHMPTIRKARCLWGIEVAHDAYGEDRSPAPGRWPDTETAFNLGLRDAGITPLLIADETNYERFVDDFVDHTRSFPGSKLYSPDYHSEAGKWALIAVEEAKARIRRWKRDAPDPPLTGTTERTPQTRLGGAGTPGGGSDRAVLPMNLRIPVARGAEVSIEQGGGLARIFADASGSVELANPIRVRTAGGVVAFAPRGTYRVTFRDSRGQASTLTVSHR